MEKKMKYSKLLPVAFVASLSASLSYGAEVEFQRFFGICDDEYGSVTDLAAATGECGIIQVMTNKYNAENGDGDTIVVRNVPWGDHYQALTTSVAGGTAPDISVMHRSQLPNYALRDLLTPLDDLFASAGIDSADFAGAALDAVTQDGAIYGLPFDVHTLLWHVNLDLMTEAGLVDDAGNPLVPGSVEELFAHAAQFKEATGKEYLALRGQGGPFVGWVFLSLVWQQGGKVFDAENKAPNLDSPEAKAAAELIAQLFNEGVANPAYDSAGTQQAFIQGDAGNMIYGTWVVNKMDAQAASGEVELKNYYVQEFPALMGSPAVWSDTHMWVVPQGGNADTAETEATARVLAYLYEQSGTWSRTGHLPVRTSYIESDDYTSQPHRSNIADAVKNAQGMPRTMPNQSQALSILNEEIVSLYQSDKYSSYEEMAEAATARLNRILRRW